MQVHNMHILLHVEKNREQRCVEILKEAVKRGTDQIPVRKKGETHLSEIGQFYVAEM